MTDDKKKLLLDACDWVEANVPPERFDLGVFWSDRYECGSVGCFVGWAARVPAVNAAGLFMSPHSNLPHTKDAYGEPALYGFRAVKEVFGMSIDDVTWLFDPSGYDEGGDTPMSEVLARVRGYVAGTWAPPA